MQAGEVVVMLKVRVEVGEETIHRFRSRVLETSLMLLFGQYTFLWLTTMHPFRNDAAWKRSSVVTTRRCARNGTATPLPCWTCGSGCLLLDDKDRQRRRGVGS